MENVNYLSVVPQTFDERVAMYMKSKKEDLAKMLAESAKYTNPDGCAELKDKQSECKGTTYTSASLDLKDENMETFHVNMKKGQKIFAAKLAIIRSVIYGGICICGDGGSVENSVKRW